MADLQTDMTYKKHLDVFSIADKGGNKDGLNSFLLRRTSVSDLYQWSLSITALYKDIRKNLPFSKLSCGSQWEFQLENASIQLQTIQNLGLFLRILKFSISQNVAQI